VDILNDIKLRRVFSMLLEKALAEKKNLYNVFGTREFGRFGSYEELYRYWLLIPLFKEGYKNIKSNEEYPDQKERREGKQYCDIVADETLWIELKTWCPTTVNFYKLIKHDPERLNSIKKDGIVRVYCIACITENELIPDDLSKIQKQITESIGKEPMTFSEKNETVNNSRPEEYLRLFVWVW